MAPFPASVTHWHLTLPYDLGADPSVRYPTREDAIAAMLEPMIRAQKVVPSRRLGNAIEEIKSGRYDSVRFGERETFLAYGCACPPIDVDTGHFNEAGY